MLFNSFNFWLIFPFIFLLYWLIPAKCKSGRNLFLIVVSLLLYMNWNPAFVLILLYVVSITFIGSLLLAKKRVKFISIIILLTLFPLLVFKYYNFINESVYSLLSFCNVKIQLRGLNYAIPVGISFFTFQALGYMLDVYYSKIEPEKNFLDYLLFCVFFPQTASGPISKASELLPQIKNPHKFNYNQARNGLQILLWGIFLKVVVADRLGIYVDTVFSNYIHYSGLTCLFASFCYSFQIYGDFAGYSFMAVGIAKLVGYDLVSNFERPYLATSITLFWRRWHISLTRWLTNYVYIPLGGNRCSLVKQYGNIMTTFLVSGLWHGANWTFIIWGGIHGFLQILEKFLGIDPKGKYAAHPLWLKMKCFRILATFLFVSLAWIFFRMPTISDAFCFIGKIIMNFPGKLFLDSNTNTILSFSAMAAVIVKEICEEYFPKISLFNNSKCIIRWISYFLIFVSIITFGVLDSGNFIYVSF